ncbi:hypothetical protein PHYBLDRAFT_172053 [Phycomyces blakesleeanus NRRL 1555(-)]|uniref:Uncharacterized protein n=1 Tax=Phycomyces blakesleeanus (strain ATCC 8743b / DSM 1359 / FGSC 10004 / NBRC 33097 / NRRL 1555) TaxID=763407 RepID=A0A167LB56_PHYB8|nr:hypothetical protein PHYBLDRAFT_172053 [Phycomyces blakesleeanus NRRL 1555(-)]OAD70037.1 hypothetical protein PHYBLDRAFT_172053 [Phycomyces blakesleeanus NRRL 1555(-)]|eukprot:XP_018288077.1 hypothetical protein PHYBLDRAFT_172053 [Phycomyces blakesleeanus NRRL 1555(-)]
MPVQRYTPIPEILTVHVANLKQAVDDYLPKYGAVTMVRKGADMENQQEEHLSKTSSSVKHAKRIFDQVIKAHHVCNRSGEKEIKEKLCQRGDFRFIQRSSKENQKSLILKHSKIHIVRAEYGMVNNI